MKTFLLILGLFCLFSCANTVESTGDVTLNGEYKISELQGENLIQENIIFSFNPVGNRVSGNLGCNQFSALYHLQGDKLEFSTPMNTRKYCEGKMDVERQILSSLGKASRLDQIGTQVIVYSTQNDQLMTLTKLD